MRKTIQVQVFLVFLVAAASAAAQTTINGGRAISGAWDASNAASSKPAKTGPALPAACGVGEQFFLTTAAPGSNLYLCAAVNTWSPASAAMTNQQANRVYAGPASGSAALPAFRALTEPDLPATAVLTDQSNTYTAGTQNMTGAAATLPARMGTALPATCMQGELFILSTALPGKNLNLCYTANNWAQIGGGSGAGANGGPAASAGTCGPAASGSVYFPSDSPYSLWCSGTAWQYRLSGVSVTPPDDSQFSWDLQNGATISISGGTTATVGDVLMTAPAGSSSAFTPSMRAINNPYGNVWTLTAVLAGSPTVNYNGQEFGGFGIYVRNGTTGDSFSHNTGSLRFDYTGGSGLGQFSMVAADTSNSTYQWGLLQGILAISQVSIQGPVWMRLHSDGTTLTAMTSVDSGQNWRAIATMPVSAVAGPSGQIGQVGWYVTPSNSMFSMSASLLHWSIVNK